MFKCLTKLLTLAFVCLFLNYIKIILTNYVSNFLSCPANRQNNTKMSWRTLIIYGSSYVSTSINVTAALAKICQFSLIFFLLKFIIRMYFLSVKPVTGQLIHFTYTCLCACCCKVDSLLYELREPILLTASWLTLRTQLKLEMRPDISVYMTLSSVCDAFYEVVRDRRCRRILRRTLKGLSHSVRFSFWLTF